MDRSMWLPARYLKWFLLLLSSLFAPTVAAQTPPVPTETAILTGVLSDGEVIPLPVFANGDSATEDQSKWLVSINDLWTQGCPALCYTEEGRVVRVRTCNTYGKANYMVIATRPVPPPTMPPTTFPKILAFNGSNAVDSDGNYFGTIGTFQAPCYPTLNANLIGNLFNGPPPSPIVDVGISNGGAAIALANGDVYFWCTYNTPPPGYLVRAGNIFSASGTSAAPVSSASEANRLSTNRPNPFNPRTRIPYEVRAGGKVSVRVYDSLGRVVRILEDGIQAAGQHTIEWDGRTDRGTDAASGSYFVRAIFPDGSHSERKVTILR